jgi:hypothetical protein
MVVAAVFRRRTWLFTSKFYQHILQEYTDLCRGCFDLSASLAQAMGLDANLHIIRHGPAVSLDVLENRIGSSWQRLLA